MSDMYSHRNEFPQELWLRCRRNPSKIFSFIRASANTGPACLRAKNEFPKNAALRFKRPFATSPNNFLGAPNPSFTELPPPRFTENPFFPLKSASSHPLPKNRLLGAFCAGGGGGAVIHHFPSLTWRFSKGRTATCGGGYRSKMFGSSSLQARRRSEREVPLKSPLTYVACPLTCLD